MKHSPLPLPPSTTNTNQRFHVCCWWTNAGCSLRPDHKPVERSQQGGNSITQRALQWLDGTQGTIPCDVTRAMWNHLAGKSQMCLTAGLNEMDLTLSSSRSRENAWCDKQFATTRQQILELNRRCNIFTCKASRHRGVSVFWRKLVWLWIMPDSMWLTWKPLAQTKLKNQMSHRGSAVTF